MTEKRFSYEYDEYNGNLFDNEFNTFYHIEDSEENIELFCMRVNKLSDENEQLKQQLNYIQNSISEHIKHQKTELGQKALKEIINDYNEWLLGHKGSDFE